MLIQAVDLWGLQPWGWLQGVWRVWFLGGRRTEEHSGN
jgi:hypothetical protein